MSSSDSSSGVLNSCQNEEEVLIALLNSIKTPWTQTPSDCFKSFSQYSSIIANAFSVTSTFLNQECQGTWKPDTSYVLSVWKHMVDLVHCSISMFFACIISLSIYEYSSACIFYISHPESTGSSGNRIKGDPYIEGGSPGAVAGLSYLELNNPAGNSQRYSFWARSVTDYPRVIKQKVRLFSWSRDEQMGSPQGEKWLRYGWWLIRL